MNKKSRWLLYGMLAGTVTGVVLLTSSRAAEDENYAEELAILERTGKAFSAVAAKAIPAVVFVEAEEPARSRRYHRGYDPYRGGPYRGDPFRHFFGYPHPEVPEQDSPKRQGSGFIVSEEGYILTNNHIVGDTDKIKVHLHDGRVLDATLVGADPESDVAVIKVDAKDLPVVALGDSDRLDIGEWVIAVGNPFGLTETVTVGIVSAEGRSIGIAEYENLIQTDAAINPGNSGGPLLNIKGEAIGINTAIYSQNGGYMGIGFAIPMNMARKIKDQLVDTGDVRRGHIGVVIQDMNQDLAHSLDIEKPEGILISGVAKGGAGDQAGLEEGDVILELNGDDVGSVQSFRSRVASTLPGTEVELQVLRDGKVRGFTFALGALEDAGPQALASGDVGGLLGLAVGELTRDLAMRFGYEPGNGVLVTEVQAGSVAARNRIEPGHLVSSVNRVRVRSVEEFDRALAEAAGDEFVLLLVTDGRATRFVALRLDE